MSKRRVLVQLDDDLANRLDQLASKWGTSRSELLSVGAIVVLDATDLIRSDDELRGAYRRIPQDSGIVQLAAHLAAATLPRW
jgi:metal-responsive CopG/Arc/MetJ family transcriptional regulator